MTRRGFTLIELLVVIAVVGVLVALLLPAVQQARERARAVECLSHLRQLGIALHNYHDAHGVFPPSFVRQEDGNPPPPPGAATPLQYRCHWTGYHMLLPFLDQQPLYDQYDFRGTWLSSMTDVNDRSAWRLNQTVLPVLICPSAPHESLVIGSDGVNDLAGNWMGGSPTDYSFSHGADIIRALPGVGTQCPGGPFDYWQQWPASTRGVFGYNSTCRVADVQDGASQTIAIGEKAGGLLSYAGWNSSFPRLKVEYPWAMAAVTYFSPTGAGTPNGAWVAGPYGVTQDIRLPDCPTDPPTLGVPFPINPMPRILQPSIDDRPLFSFQSAHAGGAHFLMVDGSARFVSETIDHGVYRAVSTIAGGETIGSGAF